MGAAPPRRRVLSRAAFETRTLLANGEQLLVSLVLPALALVGLTLASVPDLGPGARADLALAGTLALAVVSTAFTGQAIATGFDRRAGVLRQLGSTPLGRDGLLAGKALAVLAVLAVQVVVLGGIGLALGARPVVGGLLPALLSLLLGAGVFVALALLLAGALRAEAVLAVANLLWVALLGLGTLVPTALLPGPLATVAPLLPSGALGDALRSSVADGGWPWGAWGVLVGWGVLAGGAALRTFRWEG
ncbi:ABC transporter permease [Oryzobacter telluris]|uniref:ABC transporter permease n=1 Tax=Oryzobacter telluris TaxID=3149179 RepID=UPI00370D5166